MRTVEYYKANEVERAIKITADDRDESGASHDYELFVDGQRADTKIHFQKGPIAEAGINGLTNESLLAVVIDRLDGFLSGKFPSRETAVAKTKCEEALMWLNKRTHDRLARGVEGQNKA